MKKLNNLSIKIINLKHRADRRDEAISEFRSLGCDLSQDNFFDAKYEPEFGIYGCGLSHAMVVGEFLFAGNHEFLLVLEDDFSIQDKENFFSRIESMLANSKEWDVFLLGYNQAVPIEDTKLPFALRCINSQTASGYVVHHRNAHLLVSHFFRAASLLRQYKDLPSPNREIAKHLFAHDILWKELQITHRFLICVPALVIQRESYSDIEKKNVNYGV